MPDVKVSREAREAPVSQQGYHQPLSGGTTAQRPTDPYLYQMYFDTTATHAIWWNGTAWVDHAGVAA